MEAPGIKLLEVRSVSSFLENGDEDRPSIASVLVYRLIGVFSSKLSLSVSVAPELSSFLKTIIHKKH
jgi:hypothetical protein